MYIYIYNYIRFVRHFLHNTNNLVDIIIWYTISCPSNSYGIIYIYHFWYKFDL